MHQLNTVVLDKTGTLTEGRPRVVESTLSDAALRLAAAAEKRSEHPLGRAIVEYAEAKGIQLPDPEAFQSLTGRGVTAKVEGTSVRVGNRAFLTENGIPVSDEAGGSFVAVDGRYQGFVVWADPLRSSSKKAVADLQSMGIDIVLLTGDQREAAEQVAQACGIARVVAGVLPEGKTAEIIRLKSEGRIVGMVGDGINDAPALAQADVGFAMGGGTDIAMEAGDVALLRSDLAGIAQSIALARATWKIMQQNLGWALIYNVLAIPAAAFGLLNPVIASAAMALSSISVVSNSLRLKRFRSPA
jgi:Cu+-exporting ATPase